MTPNVFLRSAGEHNTQHFYYTYPPTPGAVELEKSAVRFEKADTNQGFAKSTEPLEGAEFELYEVVDTKTTPCGLEPDLENTEKVTVCQYQEPNTPAHFKEMLEGQPQGCEEKTVRKIVLDGTTGGQFKTDAAGKFTPEGEPSLEPGNYLTCEVASPDNHLILNKWIAFTIYNPTQADQSEAVQVVAKNYLKPTPPPVNPSDEPETPTDEPDEPGMPSDQPDEPETPSGQSDTPEKGNTPDAPKLSVTGTPVLYLGGFSLVLLAMGLMLRLIYKRY